MKNPNFVSVLADPFSDYVTFRHLGGVDPDRQIGLLRFFDRFLDQESFRGRWPTPQVIERYIATTQHLHPGNRTNRFSVVRSSVAICVSSNLNALSPRKCFSGDLPTFRISFRTVR